MVFPILYSFFGLLVKVPDTLRGSPKIFLVHNVIPVKN